MSDEPENFREKLETALLNLIRENPEFTAAMGLPPGVGSDPTKDASVHIEAAVLSTNVYGTYKTAYICRCGAATSIARDARAVRCHACGLGMILPPHDDPEF